jgi:hypothetical protein
MSESCISFGGANDSESNAIRFIDPPTRLLLQGAQGLLTFYNVPGIFSCQIFCMIEVRTLSLRDNSSTGCWYPR